MGAASVEYHEKTPLVVRGERLAGCADYQRGKFIITVNPGAQNSTIETFLHEICHCKSGDAASDVRRHNIKNMSDGARIMQRLIFDNWETRAEKFVNDNIHLWR